MSLLAPVALLALPLLGFIIALYLLKYRRPFAPIGSLFLWQSVVRDREANSLWQRLHISGLLLLQLLAMLVLILALARPWVPASAATGQNAIIVVDVSASMGAVDGAENGYSTRLQAAIQEGNGLVDNLPQGATAALISTDEHASIVVAPTSDKSQLRAALNTLAPQPSGTDMREAMQLATALSARQSNSTLWVLSDGAFPAASALSDTIQAQVHFVPFGRRASNQAITALSVHNTGGTLQLFAQIANADVLSVTRRLDLSVDDQPWDSRTVALSPGQTQQVIIDDVPLTARVVQAQLAGVDDLSIDDTAWTVNRNSAPANVLLVSGGNKFLELAAGLLPNVTLYKVAPADYDSTDVINGAPPDLTIFDSDVPTAILQKPAPGNLLYVGPIASTPLFTVTGQVLSPQPRFSEEGSAATVQGTGDASRDPLLRYVDLSGLHVAKAEVISVPEWAHTVLNSDKGPLLVAGALNGRKIAAFAFDLHDSDLPVQTAYPLLMRNLITYLLPDPTGGVPAEVAPRSIVNIAAYAQNVDRIVIEDPAAKQWSYPLSTGTRRVPFAQTGQIGVYYITEYAAGIITAQEAFAVNLGSRDESMTAPNPSPVLPRGLPASGPGVSTNSELLKREMWPYVALGGIVVLLIEWLVAQRTALRRAMTEWRARRALRKLENL